MKDARLQLGYLLLGRQQDKGLVPHIKQIHAQSVLAFIRQRVGRVRLRHGQHNLLRADHAVMQLGIGRQRRHKTEGQFILDHHALQIQGGFFHHL